MNLKFKKLHHKAITPQYQTPGAACFDLHALTVNGWSTQGDFVEPGSVMICSTGLAFEIPEGHVMLIYSRSGQGFKHHTRLSNAVGVVDSDFRGEVKVQLIADEYSDPPLFVNPGDRIAQAMVIPVPHIEIVEVGELSETLRGEGGFGSTGK